MSPLCHTSWAVLTLPLLSRCFQKGGHTLNTSDPQKSPNQKPSRRRKRARELPFSIPTAWEKTGSRNLQYWPVKEWQRGNQDSKRHEVQLKSPSFTLEASLQLLSFYQLLRCASSQMERQITGFAQIVSLSSGLLTTKTSTIKPTQTNKQTKRHHEIHSTNQHAFWNPERDYFIVGKNIFLLGRSSLRLAYHRNLEFWFWFVNWDGGLQTLPEHRRT